MNRHISTEQLHEQARRWHEASIARFRDSAEMEQAHRQRLETEEARRRTAHRTWFNEVHMPALQRQAGLEAQRSRQVIKERFGGDAAAYTRDAFAYSF